LKTSIIIATHDRPRELLRLIEALSPQITSGRELLIAENGTAAPSAITSGATVTAHLHDTRPGKCRIQNRAIRESSGELLIFLDDDLTVGAEYVGQAESFFEHYPEFAAMKGRVLPVSDPAAAGPLAPYMDLPLVDHGKTVTEVRGVLGANMAFRRSAFDKVGLFDERLGPGAAGHEEETEISARLRTAGLRIGYSPAAVAYHDVDPRRADRDRFLRVWRERGRCRMLHGHHGPAEIIVALTIASVRSAFARMLPVGVERRSREDRRLATARGMLDGLRGAG